MEVKKGYKFAKEGKRQKVCVGRKKMARMSFSGGGGCGFGPL
jgi:hypothetical protein